MPTKGQIKNLNI